VNLSGGEILAFKGYQSLLTKCSTEGIKAYVLTNGTLIDSESAMFIADTSYQVQISIDGPTAKSNDFLRGAGVYDKALRGLYHFRGLDVALRLAMIVTPETIQDYESNFVAFARKLQDDFQEQIQLRITTDLIDGRSVSKYQPDTVSNLQSRVDRLFDELWGINSASERASIQYKRRLKNLNCGFGREISINASGKVFPCPVQVTSIGDIRQDSLESLFMKTHDANKSTEIDKFTHCSDCDIKYICGGGCRIGNHQLTGSYIKPSFCNNEYKQNILSGLVAGDLFQNTRQQHVDRES
jgi:radical SAM protein with 4Fe4S-binding SPASM domain